MPCISTFHNKIGINILRSLGRSTSSYCQLYYSIRRTGFELWDVLHKATKTDNAETCITSSNVLCGIAYNHELSCIFQGITYYTMVDVCWITSSWSARYVSIHNGNPVFSFSIMSVSWLWMWSLGKSYQSSGLMPSLLIQSRSRTRASRACATNMAWQ